MTRKRFSEEDILGILRQIELELSSGSTVGLAIRTATAAEGALSCVAPTRQKA